MLVSKDKDYDVGFGKPPKATQWKSGQSGNPKGRPKKKTDFPSLVIRELEDMVLIQEGNSHQKITKKQALAKRLIAKALAGDVRSLKSIIEYIGETPSSEISKEITIVIDEDDLKTL